MKGSKHWKVIKWWRGIKTQRLLQRSHLADQDSQVGLRCSSDHVGDKAFVSRGVQDGEMFLLCLKVSSPHLYRLPFVPLLLVCVQSPWQVPARMFTNLITVKQPRKKKKSAGFSLPEERELTMSPCSFPLLLFHISQGFAFPPFQLSTWRRQRDSQK